MYDSQLLGILILFGAIIGGRLVSESALELLASAKKAELLDAFSGMRKYSLLVIGLLILPALVWPKLALGGWYFGLPIACVLVMWWMSYRKLLKLEVGTAYIRRYVLAQLMILGGLVAYAIVSVA